MLDALARARHFKKRAEECEALANFFSNERFKERYRRLAKRYLELAEAEEQLGKCKSTTK